MRDHGAGIPPAELQRIFGAFVQSSSSKDGSSGTGLGLAICKKILDAHDGTITAVNMLDGGAARRGVAGADRPLAVTKGTSRSAPSALAMLCSKARWTIGRDSGA